MASRATSADKKCLYGDATAQGNVYKQDAWDTVTEIDRAQGGN